MAERLIAARRSQGAAETAYEKFLAANGDLRERRDALDRKANLLRHRSASDEWRSGWLAVLPDAGRVFLEILRLQEMQRRFNLVAPHLGIPFEELRDGRDTLAEVKRVISILMALFGDSSDRDALARVEQARQSCVFPSSVAISWWRG